MHPSQYFLESVMYRKPKLSIETLEARTLMSTTYVDVSGPAPHGISLTPFGVLRIKGDERQDVARVWVENGQVHATHKHLNEIELTSTGGGATFDGWADEPEFVAPLASVK